MKQQPVEPDRIARIAAGSHKSIERTLLTVDELWAVIEAESAKPRPRVALLRRLGQRYYHKKSREFQRSLNALERGL